jgi:hypothetical protein
MLNAPLHTPNPPIELDDPRKAGNKVALERGLRLIECQHPAMS